MNNQFSLSARLRQLRKERGLSQRDLADLANISSNAISLIERDETSPSVATLQNLASALNVKMSYFFDGESAQSILHVRAADRPAITSQGARIEGISERLPGQELEPFFVSLDPDSGSGERPVVHAGHEFVYCLRGTVEYHIDGQVFELKEGDFLLFEGQLPHQWHNSGRKQAQLLLVLQTPNSSNEPVRRHFINQPSLIHMG
jgi:transcriptional regulator with XRE-family HTH domain